MAITASLRKWRVTVRLQAAIMCMLVCLPMPVFAAELIWSKLKLGASEKDVSDVLGEPNEQRGNKLLYGPKRDLKQTIVEMDNKKLARLTVHFSNPVKNEDLFDPKDRFEPLKLGPKLSRQRLRMIGLPDRGWVIELTEDRKIRSISVEKAWKPKAAPLSWAEAAAFVWAEQ